jgi:hypothetical protein
MIESIDLSALLDFAVRIAREGGANEDSSRGPQC